jgi:hypothetical protein
MDQNSKSIYYSVSMPFLVCTNWCSLNLLRFIDSQRWTVLSSHRILNIEIADLHLYPHILQRCPSLARCTLELILPWAKPRKEFSAPSHTSLRRLDLRLHGTTFPFCQIIDWLLSLAPNWIPFSVVESFPHVSDINIDSFAVILHQSVSKLA